MNGYNWHIEHQCPQCGAPVILEETDRIFLCSYCRTKLYLVPHNCFHYYISPPDSVSGEIYYTPYWRIKGLLFSLCPNGITHRYLDTNTLALKCPNLPVSLGVRPQVLRLKFFTPNTPGRFLPYHTSARETLSSFGPSDIHHSFIGETTSLIFFPLYAEGGELYDSFAKKPVSGGMVSPELLPDSEEVKPGTISFIPTLCPQCGWDLLGERNSVVLICQNCNSAWECRRNTLVPVPFIIMTGGDTIAHYLPFWRMKARVEGVCLESYADLIRLGNLPKAISRKFEDTSLYFWSPAFKIQPTTFLRWARQLTVYQPAEDGRELSRDMSLYPVTLSAAEAKESILITLADIITTKKIIPLIPDIRITVHDLLLVYHPFTTQHNELIHSVLKLSIDTKSLIYGALL